jgi:hypothetical protein
MGEFQESTLWKNGTNCKQRQQVIA